MRHFFKPSSLFRFLVSTGLLFALLINPAQAIKAVPTQSSTPSCQTPFVDVKGHWAEDAICTLYKIGAVKGISEKNFDPDRSITRAEFLKITLEALDYSVYPVQSAAFTDLTAGEWSYRYITFAHAKGFVQGYEDGSFHPDASITRAEALSILIKMAGYAMADTSSVNVHFSDIDSTDWYAVAVAIAVKNSLVEGYGDGSFRPNNPLSRAEACMIILRAKKQL